MTDTTTAPIPYHELAETLKATRAALMAWRDMAHGLLHIAVNGDDGIFEQSGLKGPDIDIDDCFRRLCELRQV